MNRGGKFLISTTLLAVAGCGGDMGKLEIRSTPTRLAQGQQPVPQRIAEARGQLAIGNVGLALEAFRLAAREDPNSTEALLGIAVCYDHMGRFDLSRRNYEAALAIAPADAKLLAAFAGSLQLQGRTDEAISVRQEIAARAATAEAIQEAAAAPPVATPAPVAAAPAESAAVAVPQSVQAAAAPEPELPLRTWASQPVGVTASAPEKVAIAAPALSLGRVEMAAEEEAVGDPVVQTAAAGPALTIKLPPARPVHAAPVALAAAPAPERVALEAEPAPPMPAEMAAPPFKPKFSRVPEPAFAQENGPHLERVSTNEIALITVSKPVWRSTTVARTERSTKIRFIPLQQASTLPSKVRLLNAARVNRLAFRTRSWLVARGWSPMTIGDAPATRSRSVILYPPGQRAIAQNLSRQFGFQMEERAKVRFVTMLLGRDAARIEELRPRTA